MIRRLSPAALLLVLSVVLVAEAQAAGVKNVTVTGNTLTAELNLPGINGDISVEFEDAGNLTPANVGLSASLFLPTDPLILSRLPAGGLVSIPVGFPVKVTFSPPVSGGFWYRGPVRIHLHTEALNYTLGTPLRLFSASPGGAFHDATDEVGSGSYRVGAYTPQFAGDHVVVVDLRVLDEVVWSKIDYLEGLVAANAGGMSPQITTNLQGLTADIRAAVAEDRIVDARDLTADFSEMVEGASGEGIPDLWTADGDDVNVAEALTSAASTLGFSLLWLDQGPL